MVNLKKNSQTTAKDNYQLEKFFKFCVWMYENIHHLKSQAKNYPGLITWLIYLSLFNTFHFISFFLLFFQSKPQIFGLKWFKNKFSVWWKRKNKNKITENGESFNQTREYNFKRTKTHWTFFVRSAHTNQGVFDHDSSLSHWNCYEQTKTLKQVIFFGRHCELISFFGHKEQTARSKNRTFLRTRTSSKSDQNLEWIELNEWMNGWFCFRWFYPRSTRVKQTNMAPINYN